jgi:exopolysaccharide biosynthesis polyprenyl glycosylphosphotransferase
MFQHRELGLVKSYQTAVLLLLTALFWGYFAGLSHFAPHWRMEPANYFSYYLAIVFGFQISFLQSRHNDVLSVTSGILESHRIISPHILFASAITVGFWWVTKDETVSRRFLVSFIPIAYFVLVIFSRYFALDLFRFFLRHQRQRLVLIGQPAEINNVHSLLAKASLFGFETVGIITEAPAECLPPGIVKLGNPEDLEAVLDQHEIGNIFILGSPRDRRVLGGWMRLAEARGCRVSLVNDLDIFLQRRLSYFRCDNVDLIELRQEPLQNLVNRAVKRAFDIVVSLFIVCFILPPMTLVIWFLQRIQAPGPIFFIQNRSGVDNRHFTIFKFRTMYADQCGSVAQATLRDDRIYPLGGILRRFSLDEFPQFLNVLLGHMSLVGPRPHMLQHDKVFAEKMSSYGIRRFVKPGLTGLAQIRGFRGEAVAREDIILRVECDIEYIETWSFFLDVRIVWQTILQVIRPPKTAY